MHIYLAPPRREDRREAECDTWDEQFPVCGCCGDKLRGGDKFFQLVLKTQKVLLCQFCAEEMIEHPCYVEDVEYGN